VVATDYPDLEIILADNGSTDASVGWVRQTYPEVRIVSHPENWGFCRGNNEAVPHATGDVLLFLNNDVEVDPGWLSPLVNALLASDDVAAVQPKLLQASDRSMFEYAGAAGGFIDALGYPFTRGRIFFTMEPDRGQYDDARDVFWATGAAMLVRREAFEAAGGFDEAFFMHMEEIDLCWRLHRMGYRVRVEPASVVYHIGGGSLPQGDHRKAYYNFRNGLLLLYKNLPPREWARIFPRRAAQDLLAAARSLALGRPAEVLAVLRAYNDAHFMKKRYADLRPSSAETPALPIYRGNIVRDYFLRGRKHFSDLRQDRFGSDAAGSGPATG
jgi:GT2 family glycosyltransferase